MLLWWISFALAAPACAPTQPVGAQDLSVAWISPQGARASGRTWLTVVRTAELRAWTDSHDADLTRLLQGLGLRRSDEPPRRPWKVVVFDIEPDRMCRPVATEAPGANVGGVTTCLQLARGVDGRDRGCGHAIDFEGDARGPDLFQIRWDDAARQGFCVLPVGRFLDAR
jgi:hypothetical protein